jgi:hypothetical protein
MRRRYRQDPITLEMVEITADTTPRSDAPVIWDDLPGYESPVTGQWVEGRRARRNDLSRTHSRPYEGFEQEKKEADRFVAERERKLDNLAEKIAHRGWAEAPERIRKVFRGR